MKSIRRELMIDHILQHINSAHEHLALANRLEPSQLVEVSVLLSCEPDFKHTQFVSGRTVIEIAEQRRVATARFRAEKTLAFSTECVGVSCKRACAIRNVVTSSATYEIVCAAHRS